MSLNLKNKYYPYTQGKSRSALGDIYVGELDEDLIASNVSSYMEDHASEMGYVTETTLNSTVNTAVSTAVTQANARIESETAQNIATLQTAIQNACATTLSSAQTYADGLHTNLATTKRVSSSTITEDTSFDYNNFDFTATATSVTLPTGYSWDGGETPELEVGKKYEVSLNTVDKVAMISQGA